MMVLVGKDMSFIYKFWHDFSSLSDGLKNHSRYLRLYLYRIFIQAMRTVTFDGSRWDLSPVIGDKFDASSLNRPDLFL